MRAVLKGIFFAFLFFFPYKIFAFNAIVLNENVLNDKVVKEINLIGKELYDKTGIFVGVAIAEQTPFEDLFKLQEQLIKPNVLLILSKISHKVDIIGTKDSLLFFDKNKVLSPYSGTGTILPILTSSKGKDVFNAAVLNGYADICDKIAKYFNLELENSIGNANRDTINILRILIYGFICFSLLYFVQRKMKRKRNG